MAWIRTYILPQMEQEMAQQDEVEFQLGAPTFLRIYKEEAVLEAWLQDERSGRYELFKTYPICNYSGTLGPKLQEGDKQSPEGFYEVSEEWLWPSSKYHLAMNIGFPNEYDKAHGRTGSHLMIHGDCFSEGCYAMTDPQIEEIYVLTEQSLLAGNESVPVHIFPFRMNGVKLEEHRGDPWMRYWINLKRGHDIFEQTRVPPIVGVTDGLYVFEPQRYITAEGGV